MSHTDLHKAVAHGEPLAVIQKLVREIDVNTQNEEGSTPLMIATWRGDLNAVRVLLEAGADVNIKRKDGKTASDIAIDHAMPSFAHKVRLGTEKTIVPGVDNDSIILGYLLKAEKTAKEAAAKGAARRSRKPSKSRKSRKSFLRAGRARRTRRTRRA